ncbi:MAG: hypothetical protein Ct9H300mP1_22660 [Planctomycetaceae bacterium]|nr:MAG: hypothetical protein Ct9H300mP1_22660 [Planctomycetaceae bacterium]
MDACETRGVDPPWQLAVVAGRRPDAGRWSAQRPVVAGSTSGRFAGIRRGRVRARFVSSFQRDRTIALGWLEQAVPLVAAEAGQPGPRNGVGFTRTGQDPDAGSEVGQSWKLANLTDTTKLPDFEENRFGSTVPVSQEPPAEHRSTGRTVRSITTIPGRTRRRPPRPAMAVGIVRSRPGGRGAADTHAGQTGPVSL